MNQNQNINHGSDSRRFPRFEPQPVNILIIQKHLNKSITGLILDVSRNGIAVAINGEEDQLKHGEEVAIEVVLPKNEEKILIEGGGLVVRNLNRTGFCDFIKGTAIRFKQVIDEDNHDYDNLFFNGPTQSVRIANQAEIARADMNYLGGYRQELIDGQLRLFILTLTFGVTMASAYFGFLYNRLASQAVDGQNLRQWLPVIAFMPGLLSISCAFISIHKSVFIQRIDSYLSVIKERIVSFQYPRHYQGWESGVYKLRHIFYSKKCDTCWFQPKCSDLSQKKCVKTKKRIDFFKYPFLSIEHIIMYSTFLLVYLISAFTALIEMFRYNNWALLKIITTVAISIFTIFIIRRFRFFLVDLRDGKNSFEVLKRSWTNILCKCTAAI